MWSNPKKWRDEQRERPAGHQPAGGRQPRAREQVGVLKGGQHNQNGDDQQQGHAADGDEPQTDGQEQQGDHQAVGQHAVSYPWRERRGRSADRAG